MADKRKALLAEDIKDNTAMFTSEDILTAAGIDKQKATELLDKVNNNMTDIIGEFLREK